MSFVSSRQTILASMAHWNHNLSCRRPIRPRLRPSRSSYPLPFLPLLRLCHVDRHQPTTIGRQLVLWTTSQRSIQLFPKENFESWKTLALG